MSEPTGLSSNAFFYFFFGMRRSKPSPEMACCKEWLRPVLWKRKVLPMHNMAVLAALHLEDGILFNV